MDMRCSFPCPATGFLHLSLIAKTIPCQSLYLDQSYPYDRNSSVMDRIEPEKILQKEEMNVLVSISPDTELDFPRRCFILHHNPNSGGG